MSKLLSYCKKGLMVFLFLLLFIFASCKGCKKEKVESLSIPFEYVELNIDKAFHFFTNI